MPTVIKVTAPGKTILHGEHAVVYKKAAIAVSLGLETEVTLVPQSKNILKLCLSLLNLNYEWELNTLYKFRDLPPNPSIQPPSETDLEEIRNLLSDVMFPSGSEFQRIAMVMFFYLYTYISNTYDDKSSFLACAISVNSELTLGSGMGSSASYAVSLATALLAFVKRVTLPLSGDDLELISKWAFCAETICHGHPSGIDNTICTYGGALLFENGKISEHLPHMPPIQIILVDSGVPRNTKVLVAAVREKFNTHQTTISSIMDAIHSISLESWKVLNDMSNSGDHVSQFHFLEELVTMNQHLLNCLGVGHSKLDTICAVASRFKCAAKLTGAGGGGCAFILVNSDRDIDGISMDSLKNTLSNLELKCWDVLLGGEGVQLSIN